MVYRSAICRLTLSGADYRRAHEACHVAAGLWNDAVGWVRAELAENRFPKKTDMRKYLTALPREQRPLHAHTTEEIAYDLYDVIQTAKANKRNGLNARYPWKHKNYRPLSFSRGYGWRIRDDKLILSLGRGRSGISLKMPRVVDSATGCAVHPSLWGEIKLCWDRDGRYWELHIAYQIPQQQPKGQSGSVVAIDEGIINPMALAAQNDDGSIDVLVINGREGRSIKRRRNKSVAKKRSRQARTRPGSRKHRKLQRSMGKTQADTKRSLRDFDHQVTRKAARFVEDHDAGRVVVGDVRGIEQKTNQERRVGRHTRQQLSQWGRGRQEKYLAYKTSTEIEYIKEDHSTQTCPACLTRYRPKGRNYRCRACGFACNRDAVGAINILMRAKHGKYTKIDPDTKIRITYLRAVRRHKPQARPAVEPRTGPKWSSKAA